MTLPRVSEVKLTSALSPQTTKLQSKCETHGTVSWRRDGGMKERQDSKDECWYREKVNYLSMREDRGVDDI